MIKIMYGVYDINCRQQKNEHTHKHSVLTAIFPGELGLAGCPLNSFIRNRRMNN